MFKTIIVNTWEGWAPIASFVLTFSIFAGIMIRAWSMNKQDSDRLSSLPLDLDNNSQSPRHDH